MRKQNVWMTILMLGVLGIASSMGWAEIEINTPQDLMKIGVYPTYPLDEDYLLTADLDMTDIGITPIGTWNEVESLQIPFTGTFNGQNHVIRNLTMELRSEVYVGLFGYVAEVAAISNIRIEDGTTTADGYAGRLIGYNSGNVTNCYATGKASSYTRTWYSLSYAGGLIGYNKGDISNCDATGDASSYGNASYAGGLIGYNEGGVVTNCYATGKVYSNSANNDEYSYAGGLIGGNTGEVTDCYATGDVSSYNSPRSSSYDDDYRSCAGGLIGVNEGEGVVTDCYAMGDVSSPFSGYVKVYAGGLIGLNTGEITGCRATGVVSSGDPDDWTVKPNRSYAGGLIGYNEEGIVTDCYATGNISPYTHAGGLIGLNTGEITGCHATGVVSAYDDKGSAPVGGLIGVNEGEGVVTDCYAMGDVSSTHSTNSASWYSAPAGGLIGENEGNVTHCYAMGDVYAYREFAGGLIGESNGTIVHCYATGLVYSEKKQGGGLFGDIGDNSIITFCFWDKETTGQKHSAGVNDIFGKTTAEMKTLLTFTEVGWNFETVWNIDLAINDSYPFLLALSDTYNVDPNPPEPTPTVTPNPTLTPTPTIVLQPTPLPAISDPILVYLNTLDVSNSLNEIPGTFSGLETVSAITITEQWPEDINRIGVSANVMNLTAQANQGTFLYGKESFPVQGKVLVRAVVWCNTDTASLFVGVIDSDEQGNIVSSNLGMDQLSQTVSINNQWKVISALHDPQSGYVLPFIQVVGNSDGTEFYIDNLAVYVLEKGTYISTDLLGVNE